MGCARTIQDSSWTNARERICRTGRTHTNNTLLSFKQEYMRERETNERKTRKNREIETEKGIERATEAERKRETEKQSQRERHTQVTHTHRQREEQKNKVRYIEHET